MGRHGRIGISAVLLAAVLAVFGQAREFGFAALDDPAYVKENRFVRDGITGEGIAWAFTTFEQGNWHPLTWVSLMVDAELGGADASAFHRTNVLLHALSSILLFLVLDAMTGLAWRSAFVAALFALHPLRAESVVWIAERKDVLGALCFVATLAAYARYAARPSRPRFALVAACLALGLLAKPMLVTVPFVLLLLDIWPLRRIDLASPIERIRGEAPRLLREKVPLLLLVAASSFVTVVAQDRGGALRTFERYPLRERAANAAVSYVAYVRRTLWPADLAVYYPHPQGSLPATQVAASALLLALVTAGVVLVARRRPYATVGWLWYVGTLVPVIGIVQVGGQASADRYTYIPHIGLFLAIAWGVPDLVGRLLPAGRPERRALLAVPAVAAVSLLAWRAHAQVAYWRSNVTLFQRALEVTRENALAHDCLGNALFRDGKLEEAAAQYREALRINPQYGDAHGNLGATLMNQGKLADAESHLREAVRIDPRHARSHLNLALILLERKALDESAAHLREAVRFKPDLEVAWRTLGAVEAQRGRTDDARLALSKALELDPADREAREWLEWTRRATTGR